MSLTKPSKLLVILASLVLVLAVAYVDSVASPEITRSNFYLLPICLAAWFAGRNWGLVFAALSCVLRFVAHTEGVVADIMPFDTTIAAWNELMGLLLFAAIVVLLTKVKSSSQQLEKKVDERTAALVGEIVERKRAEESLRTLAAKLSEAEETERTRLASDIHDSIGQSLSILKMNLGVLASQSGKNGQAPGNLGEALHLIDDIIQEIRTFTFKIHPAMLEDLGLMPTLHWYAEQFETQAGIQVTVSEGGQRQALPGSLANYLFRAIKELLNNAAKHGHAREIVVTVHWRTDALRVVIDDDGCGFDPAKALAPQTRHGLGLASIRERLLALSGHIAVESEPGEGSRIILDISF